MKFFIMENFKLLEVRQTFVAVVLVFNFFFWIFEGLLTKKNVKKKRKRKEEEEGRIWQSQPSASLLTQAHGHRRVQRGLSTRNNTEAMVTSATAEWFCSFVRSHALLGIIIFFLYGIVGLWYRAIRMWTCIWVIAVHLSVSQAWQTYYVQFRYIGAMQKRKKKMVKNREKYISKLSLGIDI